MKYLRTFLRFAVLIAFAGMPSHAQQFSVLFQFGDAPGDPINPPNSGIVAQGRDGNLYSTTFIGGQNPGHGVIFKITPAGQVSTVYSFRGGSDGTNPLGGLTLGSDGDFYGTTGGGYGTIFKVSSSGVLTTLHHFNSKDGQNPYSPPIQGTDQSWYGTTQNGGLFGYGTIYKLTSSGTLTTLYNFDFTHGAFSYAPLVQGSGGDFYGTAASGGTHGAGVIFSITAAGKFTVVYNFEGVHGARPIGPLIQGNDGAFYGTTAEGGINSVGVIFRMTSSGELSVLHDMGLSADGGRPYAGLLQATDGNFYGANEDGGSSSSCGINGCGTLFEMAPSGTFSTIHAFDADTGSEPVATLLQHTSGILYGDTFCGGEGTGLSFCSPQYSGGVFYSLDADLPAFVTFLPQLSQGKVGDVIQIFGQGFTGASKVSFDGTGATFEVVGDTFIVASVPNGATTGSVKVTDPSGTPTSNVLFRVLPQIKSFSPSSAPVGTQVTIKGISLKQTLGVGFGNEVPAKNLIVVSDDEIKATVPAGAVTGPVGVQTKGGTAISTQPFTVSKK